MKRFFFAVICLIFMSGCSEKPGGAGQNNPVAQYGDSMVNSYQKGKQAGESGNLEAVKKAVEAYHALNDRYPSTLDEVKPMIGSGMDFSRYDYNPDTGAVTLKPN